MEFLYIVGRPGVKCPYCAETIPPDAQICGLCHGDLSNSTVWSKRVASYRFGRRFLYTVLIGGPLLFLRLATQESWQEALSPRRSLTNIPVKAVTSIPTPVVAKVPKSRFVSADEAQRAAIARYPLLGVAGSPFNSKFVEATRKLQIENPGYFKDSDWPMRLADDTAKSFHSK